MLLHQLTPVRGAKSTVLAISFLEQKPVSLPARRMRAEKMSDRRVVLVNMPFGTLGLGNYRAAPGSHIKLPVSP